MLILFRFFFLFSLAYDELPKRNFFANSVIKLERMEMSKNHNIQYFSGHWKLEYEEKKVENIPMGICRLLFFGFSNDAIDNNHSIDTMIASAL